ncbi:hypothetical protein B2G74_33480 [Burkholderia sp. A27]|nr:hypothetical protein B2G74_33480 [Burkholderia sp. A27]
MVVTLPLWHIDAVRFWRDPTSLQSRICAARESLLGEGRRSYHLSTSQAYGPIAPVLHVFEQAGGWHWGITIPRARGRGFKLIAFSGKRVAGYGRADNAFDRRSLTAD